LGLFRRLFERRQEDHLTLRPARSRSRTVITIAVATSTDRAGRSTQQIAPYDRSSDMVVQPKRGNVATQVEVQEWRALRGRFLNALWDSEHAGNDFTLVSDLIAAIGASDLAVHRLDRLVLDLGNDGLISTIGMGATKDQQVRLSPEGRYEVEEWLSEPDETTEHIKVPASQVYNINTMNVTGTVLQGSTATNVITTNYDDALERLRPAIAAYRELLGTADVSDDDREAIEVDLDVIEEETKAAQPRPKRLRALLLRLGAALTTGALAGVEAGTKQETIHLIEMAQKALPPG
jgi:hypothetical protein